MGVVRERERERESGVNLREKMVGFIGAEGAANENGAT